jgi:hypothetical protein
MPMPEVAVGLLEVVVLVILVKVGLDELEPRGGGEEEEEAVMVLTERVAVAGGVTV